MSRFTLTLSRALCAAAIACAFNGAFADPRRGVHNDDDVHNNVAIMVGVFLVVGLLLVAVIFTLWFRVRRARHSADDLGGWQILEKGRSNEAFESIDLKAPAPTYTNRARGTDTWDDYITMMIQCPSRLSRAGNVRRGKAETLAMIEK